jgi:hypothetical protein
MLVAYSGGGQAARQGAGLQHGTGPPTCCELGSHSSCYALVCATQMYLPPNPSPALSAVFPPFAAVLCGPCTPAVAAAPRTFATYVGGREDVCREVVAVVGGHMAHIRHRDLLGALLGHLQGVVG